MPSDPAPPVAPGDLIADKYRVDRILGAGGMGVVVAATHRELGSAVAIKLIRAEVARHPQLVARFQREARIAARLKSDHVARVTDVGTFPPGPGGAPYMVLELLDGTDLAGVLAKRGPLPVEEAVTFLLEACEAVGEAHGLGIVHRDLKPANLFLAGRAKGRPIVKVLDFGISSVAAGDDDARLTATGSVMGTPLYMAPEQMLDARKADQRSDIWALGAILYELLTGAPPFPGNTFGAVHARVLTTEAGPLSTRRPDLPAGLEAVVLRCLRKPPEERFQAVAELAAALGPFAEARGPLRSAPAIEDSATEEAPAAGGAARVQHTTEVLEPGVAARDRTTVVLGQGGPATGGAAGTSVAWDAKTTIALPPPARRRTGLAAVVAVVVLGAAVGILVLAVVRGRGQAEPSAAAVAPPGSASAPVDAPAVTPGPVATGSVAGAEPLLPPAPSTEASARVPGGKAAPRAAPVPSGKPAASKAGKARGIASER